MSAARRSTTDTGPEALVVPDHGHAGLLKSMRSEWTKLRSVRSTWICLALVLVFGLSLSVLFNMVEVTRWSSESIARKASFDPVQISQAGAALSEFVVGVIGALVITSEYSSGSIRTTLAAVPHRRTVIAAKTLVLLIVVFIISEITSFASFFVGRAILLGHGAQSVNSIDPRHLLTSANPPSLPIGAPGVLRAVFFGGLFLVMLTLIALALGFLIRNTAAAISLFVAGLLIIPIIVSLLPDSFTAAWAKYLPSNLGQSMSLVATSKLGSLQGPAVAPVPSMLIFAAYTVLFLAAALWRLSASDA